MKLLKLFGKRHAISNVLVNGFGASRSTALDERDQTIQKFLLCLLTPMKTSGLSTIHFRVVGFARIPLAWGILANPTTVHP